MESELQIPDHTPPQPGVTATDAERTTRAISLAASLIANENPHLLLNGDRLLQGDTIFEIVGACVIFVRAEEEEIRGPGIFSVGRNAHEATAAVAGLSVF